VVCYLHWVRVFNGSTAKGDIPMSSEGLGRNDLCPCSSGKKYKRCCYPRTFPDFSKPNAGIPDPYRQPPVTHRVNRGSSPPPTEDRPATIDTVEVGKTRVVCAPLPPYGDGAALVGTLAPPTPEQILAKYEAIRDGNPDGATEGVVTYKYPEMFGFAEVRMVFDADEYFRLVDGRVIGVLDLFRGMHLQMADGTVGAIMGNPERRYEIPVPPLPDGNGLWTSRVIGQVRHTAYEVVEFRWADQVVTVTPGHPVWSADRRGWVGAHELLPGERIRVAGNVVAPVEGSGRRRSERIEVFGIEVEYFHNYFVGTGADAMLVHNGPKCLVRPAVGDAVGTRLLNAEKAVIDPRKLTEYALNPAHPFGGNKAKVFESALGFNETNAESLLKQIQEGVANQSPVAGLVDKYGSRFTVDIPVTGPKGNGVVRTGWIFKGESEVPELTTLFVK
jgi:hypothetical protein